jgi:hypothetical protein
MGRLMITARQLSTTCACTSLMISHRLVTSFKKIKSKTTLPNTGLLIAIPASNTCGKLRIGKLSEFIGV